MFWLYFDIIVFRLFRLLRNSILQISAGPRFNVIVKNPNFHSLCLGGFVTDTGGPYGDWLMARGRFNYRKRWKLFAGLFGTVENGKVFSL